MELVEGVYVGSKSEPCKIKCSINLKNRLLELSSNNDISEWYKITSNHKPEIHRDINNKHNENLCICGASITDLYFVENKVNKRICQLGSSCITRIQDDTGKNILKDYNDSLRVSCLVCHKSFNNIKALDKHHSTKSYQKELTDRENSKYKIKKILSDIVIDRVKYIEDLKHNRVCMMAGCNRFIIKNTGYLFCLTCYRRLKNKRHQIN